MVYRVYVEKRAPYDEEAQRALAEFNTLPGVSGITGLMLLNRYDVEGIDEPLFKKCLPVVFSEPQVDDVMYSMPEADAVFAVEYLPGQFDQRADSCAECIQLVSRGERPEVLSAKVYLLYGEMSGEALEAIKHYVINPVESREASLDERASLAVDYPEPADVQTVEGFTALDADGLTALISRMGLAMDVDDAECCRAYFERVGRDPTVTELRVLDTYWSDHCRHTTFGTVIDEVEIDDPEVRGAYDAYLRIRRELGRSSKPMTLMDIATIGAKCLKKRGMLQKLDESEEINACSVKITVDNDGVEEPWLLMFKNETHNHPTEIEPFGGAATCIGGAIRDPLSGRSYVYQAMRVTGAGDPTVPLEDTLPGKLPQRKLCTGAAAGYSSYGNQIGLATGLVDELYHPGYVAKRLEIGAVVAAAPENHVVRMAPEPGDVVILLGGRTGRDGMGGAEIYLCLERAEQGCEGLAPALGRGAQALEVLLETQVYVLVAEAGGDEAGNALRHGEVSAFEGALLAHARLKAPGHGRAGAGFAADGYLGRHALRGGELVFAAEGHQHGACAYCGVEALGQTAPGAALKRAQQGAELLLQRRAAHGGGAVGEPGGGYMHAGVLLRAVGVEKVAVYVADYAPAPYHAQTVLAADARHGGGLQVFALGGLEHMHLVACGDDDGHALLALGYGQLRAVEARVFELDAVEVYVEAGGQLAYGYADAACAEVVAALYHAGDVAVTEQALELALHGGVALLHLGAAGLKAVQAVGLGGARGPAAAVAARAPAQQDDEVARLRARAQHVPLRRGGDDGAYLPALGDIAGVIELVHEAGGEAYLVAVGAVARGGGGDELALGQLARQRLAHRDQRVARAGDAHGLVDVGPARERVTDGPAYAGRRAAEGLYFRRVVVRLVLEHEQPWLLAPVHVRRYAHGAGVYLLGLVEVLELARLFEVSGAKGGQLHEREGPVFPPQLAAQFQAALICGAHARVGDVGGVDDGAEGGVAAVI